MSKKIKFIFWWAIIMGIFLPMAETIRRFKQLTDLNHFYFWFDDYILGGVLLLSAWMLRSGKSNAISYMIASWGIGTGALFLSFLGQLDYLQSGQEDPGGIFSGWFVFLVKGFILGYMIFGLLKSIRAAGIRPPHS